MVTHKTYLLDSNIFIEAKNFYYKFSFCPAFWDWLIKKNEKKDVLSVEAVYDEMKDAKDDLSDWVKKEKEVFFLKPTEDVLTSLGKVSEHIIKNLKTDQGQKDVFLNSGDIYLIAQALTDRNQYIIVTHEKYAPKDKRRGKIKIPNVCEELGIEYIDFFKMLEIELKNDGDKFILDHKINL